MKVEVLVARSSLTLCDPMNCNQAPLSMKFSRQEYWSEKKKKEYWSGLSCPPPGDLPNLGIESTSLMTPELAGGFFVFFFLPLWPPGLKEEILKSA